SYSDVLLGDIYYLDVANPVDSIGEAWLIYNIVESSNRPTIELDGMGICTYASITCILGEQQQDYFSCSMSWAADMFNSGMATHEDFVIGASLWDDTSEVDVGRAYLFLGAASFSDTEYATDGSVIVFTGENEYDHFGCASTSLDPIELGTNAVVVGASWYDKSSAGSIARNNCGRAYIFFESSTLASISAVNADIIITGEDDDNFFGCSMASGDFISGGGIDLAVGAYGYDRYKGRVYVFSAATLLSDSDGLVEASEATLKFTGENALDMFGASLDCADEFFNGSSRDALLVGAPGYSTGSTIQSGKIYVYDMDDSPPTGVDYFAYGITDVARVGTSVTGLGDLNGQLPSRDEIAFNGDGIVRIHDEQ
ncbi:MAG: hypothetical protein JW941_12265, partial [Candidatus Coatesbacteria bacterium]|nr:hypothetical protein [Candidatus Coatesbacteria bacterium]